MGDTCWYLLPVTAWLHMSLLCCRVHNGCHTPAQPEDAQLGPTVGSGRQYHKGRSDSQHTQRQGLEWCYISTCRLTAGYVHPHLSHLQNPGMYMSCNQCRPYKRSTCSWHCTHMPAFRAQYLNCPCCCSVFLSQVLRWCWSKQSQPTNTTTAAAPGWHCVPPQ